MTNIKIDITENAPEDARVLRIEDKYMDAEYYHDGSGEVFIRDEETDHMIFEADDARIKHHISDLTKRIKRLRKQADIAERCLLILKDAKKRAKL